MELIFQKLDEIFGPSIKLLDPLKKDFHVIGLMFRVQGASIVQAVVDLKLSLRFRDSIRGSSSNSSGIIVKSILSSCLDRVVVVMVG